MNNLTNLFFRWGLNFESIEIHFVLNKKHVCRFYCKGPLTLRQSNTVMENGPGLKMYFLLNMMIFHCYVSLPQGICFKKHRKDKNRHIGFEFFATRNIQVLNGRLVKQPSPVEISNN